MVDIPEKRGLLNKIVLYSETYPMAPITAEAHDPNSVKHFDSGWVSYGEMHRIYDYADAGVIAMVGMAGAPSKVWAALAVGMGIAGEGYDSQFRLQYTSVNAYEWHGTVNVTLGGITYDNVGIGEFLGVRVLDVNLQFRHSIEGRALNVWPATRQTDAPLMPVISDPSSFPWPSGG